MPQPANKIMSFDDVVSALGLTEPGVCWRSDWTLSETSYVPAGLDFLAPDFVRQACLELKFSVEITEAFLGALEMFKNNLALERLIWHCHYLLFHAPEDHSAELPKWPMPPDNIAPAAPMFYAVLILSSLPHLRPRYQARGIPEEILVDTLADLGLWMRDYQARHARWGLAQHGWLSRHIVARVFKLERLQFCFEEFPLDFHVFRNVHDKRVVVLAGEGMRFRGDGQFDGANDISDPRHGWTAEYRIERAFISGNPVSVQGQALPQKITLPAPEWREVLKQGDATIGVHIPAVGPMEHAACGESFAQALAFYPRYFPEYKYRAFTCFSWLLDHQFEQYLPPDSNIVRFMREGYLMPYPKADDTQTFQRVFGVRPGVDLKTLPQNTHLRRVIVAHQKAGGRWRFGGWLLFPEDLAWGAQVYRSQAACV